MDKLSILREDMDSIDNHIVKLFAERMEISRKVAGEKKKRNLPIYDENRENAVFLRITAMVDEEIQPYLIRLYHSVMDISRDFQKKLNENNE